jgi:hypothetical protein
VRCCTERSALERDTACSGAADETADDTAALTVVAASTDTQTATATGARRRRGDVRRGPVSGCMLSFVLHVAGLGWFHH